ncbi:Proteolipid membrane potential modulator protein [Dioscorea alata]|uniref:Proteolipid membrane potential modulator protein n=1 Tax=Dioscorea alata TaxID=55571 RepID=A0ACB7W7R8_DIOAL|nr:Proteolipid membrane potential modulator protein [Dioscorea alata]
MAFKGFLSFICCPFRVCKDITMCCCSICENTSKVCTKLSTCCCNLCTNTTICCSNVSEKAGKCSCKLCETTCSCCADCCTKLYSLCCTADVWMQIFSCCNCCCPNSAGDGDQSSGAMAVITATHFPPIGVFMKYQFGIEFWICLLLTTIGYLPGMFYAIYILSPKVLPSLTVDI